MTAQALRQRVKSYWIIAAVLAAYVALAIIMVAVPYLGMALMVAAALGLIGFFLWRDVKENRERDWPD